MRSQVRNCWNQWERAHLYAGRSGAIGKIRRVKKLRLATVAEVAADLGMSLNQVRRLLRDGVFEVPMIEIS